MSPAVIKIGFWEDNEYNIILFMEEEPWILWIHYCWPDAIIHSLVQIIFMFEEGKREREKRIKDGIEWKEKVSQANRHDYRYHSSNHNGDLLPT